MSTNRRPGGPDAAGAPYAAGSGGTHPADDPEGDELRVLLERAVPQLPAPARRLEQVRARVRRRARRRAAGLSVTAVLAIATFGLLAPGLGGAPGDPAPPAVTSLAPPASVSVPTAEPTGAPTGGPASTQAPPPTTAYRLYRFSALSGLGLRLPPGWSTLEPAGSDANYVSSQGLGMPKGTCVHPLDDFCTPLVRTLTPGGVLMMLRISHNQGMADKIRLTGPRIGAGQVLTSCRTVGGVAQLGATLADLSGSDVTIEATVCLAGAQAALQAEVRDILMNATFT
ncbi:hypothetical protein OG552_18610 [Streptomyces sp. NBC_01476]|uniref:hypothetical protein n=1 Tax=Streptomyces sp. NBC_01476 TaxID=2903881 RepID=UPI002E3628C0|nr:hypothetical protein [Streptomyces sp. NBC_01476]